MSTPAPTLRDRLPGPPASAAQLDQVRALAARLDLDPDRGPGRRWGVPLDHVTTPEAELLLAALVKHALAEPPPAAVQTAAMLAPDAELFLTEWRACRRLALGRGADPDDAAAQATVTMEVRCPEAFDPEWPWFPIEREELLALHQARLATHQLAEAPS